MQTPLTVSIVFCCACYPKIKTKEQADDTHTHTHILIVPRQAIELSPLWANRVPLVWVRAVWKKQPWTVGKKLSQWKKFSIKDPATSGSISLAWHTHSIDRDTHSHAHTRTHTYSGYKQKVCFICFARKAATLRIRNEERKAFSVHTRQHSIHIIWDCVSVCVSVSATSQMCVCVWECVCLHSKGIYGFWVFSVRIFRSSNCDAAVSIYAKIADKKKEAKKALVFRKSVCRNQKIQYIRMDSWILAHCGGPSVIKTKSAKCFNKYSCKHKHVCCICMSML